MGGVQGGGDEDDRQAEQRRTPSIRAERADRASLDSGRLGRASLPSLGHGLGGGAARNYRIAFAALWLAAQAALLVTAGRRGYGPFDFRAASESLAMKVVLVREVEGPDGQIMRQHVDDGVWSARGRDGRYHRQLWYDRVPRSEWTFDREVPVAGGSAVELARAQAALDDVTRHLPVEDDSETRRLLLDVTVRRNGHEPVVHQLVSHERTALGGP